MNSIVRSFSSSCWFLLCCIYARSANRRYSPFSYRLSLSIPLDAAADMTRRCARCRIEKLTTTPPNKSDPPPPRENKLCHDINAISTIHHQPRNEIYLVRHRPVGAHDEPRLPPPSRLGSRLSRLPRSVRAVGASRPGLRVSGPARLRGRRRGR